MQRGGGAHRRTTGDVPIDTELVGQVELVERELAPRVGVGRRRRAGLAVSAGVVPHDMTVAAHRRPVDQPEFVLRRHRAGEPVPPHQFGAGTVTGPVDDEIDTPNCNTLGAHSDGPILHAGVLPGSW
jgi:hypothetical protein